MSFLRYLMLLSLVIWIGGLIFVAFVLAPTVFAVLPTRQLAGNVVSRSLGIMHWMAISCGVIFAVTSMIDSRMVNGVADPFAARNLLICAMIILTLVGMFGIASRMLVLRQQMGVIDDVPLDDARRVEFNRLHEWSTRIEGIGAGARAGVAVSDRAENDVNQLPVVSCQLPDAIRGIVITSEARNLLLLALGTTVGGNSRSLTA